MHKHTRTHTRTHTIRWYQVSWCSQLDHMKRAWLINEEVARVLPSVAPRYAHRLLVRHRRGVRSVEQVTPNWRLAVDIGVRD